MRKADPAGRSLPREFFDRPTLDVARDLIGKVLVHRRRGCEAAGMIVEVEAYIGEGDPACHAACGRTQRNAPLYGPPGFSYVYLNYGLHYLVNAVTEPEARPAAVLIRALQPIQGLRAMRRRRRDGQRAMPDEGLCRGPGNLTSALGISLAENRLDLSASRLRIEDRDLDGGDVAWGPRIGIRVGTDKPWRCWAAANPCVSGTLRVGSALPSPRSRRC